MTEITAPKSPVTAAEFADEIREQLKYTQGVTPEQAKPADVYIAASAAIRRHLVDSWMKTQADMVNGRGAISITTVTRRFPSAAKSSRRTARRYGSRPGPCAPCRSTTWFRAMPPAV